jgi:hypothetical protein
MLSPRSFDHIFDRCVGPAFGIQDLSAKMAAARVGLGAVLAKPFIKGLSVCGGIQTTMT